MSVGGGVGVGRGVCVVSRGSVDGRCVGSVDSRGVSVGQRGHRGGRSRGDEEGDQSLEQITYS